MTLLFQAMSELGTIEAAGADARAWLNGLVTCDLAPRRPGDGVFGLATSKTGKILAEVYVAVVADKTLWIGVRREALSSLMDHFERHLVMEDVTLSDISGDRLWLFAHGPLSDAMKQATSGAENHVLPMDFTGQGTWAIIAPRGAADAVRRSLTELGAAEASADDWHQFRVERGIAAYPEDFDEQSLPQEAALERHGVSFQKGCYLGQEAVFMLEARGHVKKRLVQIALAKGQEPPVRGAPISMADGTEAGVVTSVAPRKTGDHRLLLGQLRYKFAVPGEVVIAGGRAGVVTPVIPPQKKA